MFGTSRLMWSPLRFQMWSGSTQINLTYCQSRFISEAKTDNLVLKQISNYTVQKQYPWDGSCAIRPDGDSHKPAVCYTAKITLNATGWTPAGQEASFSSKGFMMATQFNEFFMWKSILKVEDWGVWALFIVRMSIHFSPRSNRCSTFNF